MMRYLQILIIALLLVPANALADRPKDGPQNDRDRTEWFRKLKETKHNFLIKELDLTEAQRKEFFELYDAKEADRRAAEQKVRDLEKEIKRKGAAATDSDYEKAITAQYQLNTELAKIESKYGASFRKVLTKRQLYKLRQAEFEFQRRLMQHDGDKPKGKR